MFGPPRKGNQDDKAHPPIHPVKNAEKANFEEDNEWKIYEILARHFLATLSKNAIGDQTDVEVKIADEIFNCKGLIVKQQNWL
jgi:DNA topoisomerase-3